MSAVTGPLYPPFYPPAYPGEAAPPPVPEQLIANGVPLNSVWCEVEGLTSFLTAAAKRGDNATVPGRHGVIRRPRKRYDPAEVVLPLRVTGVRRDTGTIPPHAAQQLHDNLGHLLRTFHSETVALEYVRDDGSSRVANAELATEPVVAERLRSWPPTARVSVALRLFEAFWADTEDVSQTITGPTGTTADLVVFQGSTAPITDARITFYGPVSNPRLAIGEHWVQFNGVIGSGRQLVLECEHWRASSGSGTSSWTPDVTQVFREPGPVWLELPPSEGPLPAVFTHTGGTSASVEIAGRRRFLTP